MARGSSVTFYGAIIVRLVLASRLFKGGADATASRRGAESPLNLLQGWEGCKPSIGTLLCI